MMQWHMKLLREGQSQMQALHIDEDKAPTWMPVHATNWTCMQAI